MLAVDPRVLDLDDVLVTDRNAAAFTRHVFSAADGIAYLDADVVFAERWGPQPRRQAAAEALKCWSLSGCHQA